MLSTLLIGYGAGTMDLKTPKVLRVFTDEPAPRGDGDHCRGRTTVYDISPSPATR